MELAIAPVEDEIRAELRRLSIDVQTSLALARATLRVLTSLSPMLAVSADRALDAEHDRTSDPNLTAAIEDARDRLAYAPEDDRGAARLEAALIAAAAA